MDNIDEQALVTAQVTDGGEEPIESATPAEETKTTEDVSPKSNESINSVEPEETETVQKEPKKGATARIRELNGEVKSLKQRLEEITGGNGEIPVQQPRTQIDLDSEITPDQYRQHIMQEADAIVNLRLKQSEATSRIDKESSEVMRTYPQLDPDNDLFDKELSETITEAIEAQVRLNPYTTSVKKFADRLMKPFMKAVSNQVAQEKETITRQVSETALRPTNVRKPEKTAAEKSIAELEAELGIVQA